MSKQILLADDSITIQKVIALTLAGEDYKITAVDNGADAIEKAREIKPDIVLADVMMPHKNGYEVCKTLKNDPELRYVPVLLLAGTFEPFDEEEAGKAGADGYIIKPFESQILAQKVKDLLQTKAEKHYGEPVPAETIAPPEVIEPQKETMTLPPVIPSSEPSIEEETFLSPPVAVNQPISQVAVPGEDFWGTMMEEVEKKSVSMEAPVVNAKASEASSEEVWDMEEFEGSSAEGGDQEEDIWESFAFDDTEGKEGGEVMEAPLIDEASADEELIFISDEIPIGEGLTPAADVSVEEIVPAKEEEITREEVLEVAEIEEEAHIEPAVEMTETLVEEAVASRQEEVPSLTTEQEVAIEESAVMETQTEAAISEAAAPEPATASPLPSVPAASLQPVLSEEQLRSALSQVSKEVIERIVWEVVPDLAEMLIKQEIKRLQGNK